MHLLDLPPELLSGLILPLLDLRSLYCFKQTSRSCRDLASDDFVFKQLCFRQGYDRVQTCSATGVSPLTFQHWKPPDHTNELALAIAGQRCMSAYYDDCHSWESFTRKRARLLKRWQDGLVVEDQIRLQLAGADALVRAGTWRFKLDPEARLVVTSGVMGGHQAWSRDGQLVWNLSDPLSRWPHVELSDGYLLTHVTNGSDYFVVFRRDDITYPPPRYDPDQLDTILSFASRMYLSSRSSKYLPFAVFPSNNCRASKMRFPYFCASSDEHAFVYNVIDSTIRQISIADFNPEVFYVEMSDEHVFIAGDLIVSVYRFETGQLVGSFPPRSARELLDQPPPGEWTAVHHGRDLVAAHSSGYLLWAKDWRRAMSASRQEAIELVKILDIGRVVQLSVENDRCVFVVEHDGLDDNVNPRHSLFVLHLDAEATDEQLPVPRCIAFPLPTRYAPSRVECTTDEIFHSAQSPYLPGGRCRDRYEAIRFTKQAYRWRSVTGRVLFTHPSWSTRDVDDDMSVEAQLEWHRLSEETSNILFDAVAVYRFS